MDKITVDGKEYWLKPVVAEVLDLNCSDVDEINVLPGLHR